MRWIRAVAVTVLSWAIAGATCGVEDVPLLPARESLPADTSGLVLVARIVHITDTHVMDEESPARFAQAHVLTSSAWRPYEAYSTQLLDGIIREINRIHASGRPIDFVIHGGDACDNVQSNELGWFLAIMDGGWLDPLSGPDDRPEDQRPAPTLDPHAPFQAQGLYRQGVHGDLASIPWYGLLGNHDVYAIGLFPIVSPLFGSRYAPLPLEGLPGLLLPTVLNPTGSLTHGNVTPANPGPPEILETPALIESSADRAYFTKRAFIRGMFGTATGPAGHGFTDPEAGASWYSVSPLPGLRLIAMDTTDQPQQVPACFYEEGGISMEQRRWLRSQLDMAEQAGELVIVVSHHPSDSLQVLYAAAMTGPTLRAMLNEYPNVILHLAGHKHRNRVADRGGYLEIETCSTLDPPQEGRFIEIYRDEADGSIVVNYEMLSHLDDALPPLGDDPLRALREQAYSIAKGDASAARRQGTIETGEEDPSGSPADRNGVFELP